MNLYSPAPSLPPGTVVTITDTAPFTRHRRLRGFRGEALADLVRRAPGVLFVVTGQNSSHPTASDVALLGGADNFPAVPNECLTIVSVGELAASADRPAVSDRRVAGRVATVLQRNSAFRTTPEGGQQ